MPAETTKSQTHDAPPFDCDPGERGQLLHIRSNGTYRLIGHGREPLGLDVMQHLVGGSIERVVTADFDLWVNEEGLLRDEFEPNVGASWLLSKHGAPGYTIVGPAFVAANNGEESIPASTQVIAAAIALLETLGYEEDPELRPIAGGSGEEEPPARWSTADQAQRREALHLKHCGICDEGSTQRCHTGTHLATVTDAAFVAAIGDRPAAVAGGSGEDPVGDQLMAVRQLISQPEHWTKGASARLEQGTPCNPLRGKHDLVKPTSYCLTGAIIAVTEDRESPHGYYAVYNPIRATLKRLTRDVWSSVIGYNDHGTTTHADILKLVDATIAERVPPSKRPPIAGGSIEASCIGRTRCIVQKDFEHCWAHEPACHAAFCHCEDSTPATEQAYDDQLREEVRPQPTPTVAPTVATVDHEYASTDAWLRSFISGGASQDDNDEITEKRIALRREWEAKHAEVCHGCEARICTVELLPIAGGSGEPELLPFVAPTDSEDIPTLHHFTVEAIERYESERTWLVTAPGAYAIRHDGDDVTFEECFKDYGEEFLSRRISEVHHDSHCPACNELPPIAGGAVSGPKLPWESSGRGGDRMHKSGKYVIYHPFTEAFEKHGRGGMRISPRWRVNYEDRHYTSAHGWTGPVETLGTYDTLHEAKRRAQRHADEQSAGQLELKPIAGGSGEVEPHWHKDDGICLLRKEDPARCATLQPIDQPCVDPDCGAIIRKTQAAAREADADPDTYQETCVVCGHKGNVKRHTARWACIVCNTIQPTGPAADGSWGSSAPQTKPPRPPGRLTTRERKERRMYRREDWADSRRKKQAAAAAEFEQRRKELPSLGEPIKVGHHSERAHRRAFDRLDLALEKYGEHTKMAERHESKAAGIQHQLEVSIYDDDPDAIEQLQARIATLEAQRTRMKAINAHIRKVKTKDGRLPPGSLDALELADGEKLDLERSAQFNHCLGYPSYALSNLSGNIRRQVKRLERLQREAPDA